MSAAENKAVFLSYASQDGEAVRRIAEALRAAGVEVWFDQNELVGGDAWDQKIRGQIKACALFVPVISSATQARREGYFRLEWKLAAQRTHMISERQAFLLPVVIDATSDAAADVPEEFRAVQWTRLRQGYGGQAPDDGTEKFCARVGKLLGGDGAVAGAEVGARHDRAHEDGRGRATPLRKPARAWLVPIGAGALALGALFAWRPWQQPAPAKLIDLAGAVHAPALTEARKLVAQARVLFDDGDDQNRGNFFLADDLLKRALALDAVDGEVWAAKAQLSRLMLVLGYDRAQTRRDGLRTQAQRAVNLAPNSVEARLAYGGYLEQGGVDSAAEAVRYLERLSAEAPTNRRILRLIAFAHVNNGQMNEAVAAFDRANALPGGDPAALSFKASQLIWHARYDEAEAAVAQSLAQRVTSRAQILEVLLKLSWRGDLDGAVEALGRWPAWLKLEQRGGFVASQVWLWRHQPDAAIKVLTAMTDEVVHDTYFMGPKSTLLAIAHDMAGRPEAARAEWESTRRIANRLLAEDPSFKRALAVKACALAKLGETAEAEALLRQLEQAGDLRSEFWSVAATSALLRIALGRGEEVVRTFDAEARSLWVKGGFRAPQAALRLNPLFDPIRATPEFQRWMAAAPVPKLKETGVAPAPTAAEKSVAVLAFANVGGDKENEVFSDGISEELINVLGRVPGLTVKGRASSFFFKGSTVSAQEKGQRLGATYLVDGSVRRQGSAVRITAQVSRAATDEVVWTSEPLVRELKDVWAVQEEIAGLIAKALSLKLGLASASAKTAVNPEVYRLYLEGRAAWRLRTGAGETKAEQLFQQALAIDPNFARAHAGLADVWVVRAQRENSAGQLKNRNDAVMDQAIASARRALQLDPDLAEAHGVLGTIHWMDWRMDDAIREHRVAVALNPSDATAHQRLGRASLTDGRIGEALAALRRAHELDPLFARIADNYSIALIAARRFGEAVVMADRALALQPDSRQALGYKAVALADQGRSEEALAAARRYTERAGPVEQDGTPSMVAYALARVKAAGEAELLLARVPEAKRQAVTAAAWLALGKREEAFTVLRAGNTNAAGADVLLWWPVFDAVRDEPEFKSTIAAMGLTEAHARAQAWRLAQAKR